MDSNLISERLEGQKQLIKYLEAGKIAQVELCLKKEKSSISYDAFYHTNAIINHYYLRHIPVLSSKRVELETLLRDNKISRVEFIRSLK